MDIHLNVPALVADPPIFFKFEAKIKQIFICARISSTGFVTTILLVVSLKQTISSCLDITYLNYLNFLSLAVSHVRAGPGSDNI